MRGVVFRFLVVTWACVLLVLAPTGMEVQLKVLTRSTTDRYIELTFGRDYDALLELYSPDAVFHDPTGEVFQGPVAQGPALGDSFDIRGFHDTLLGGGVLPLSILESRVDRWIGAVRAPIS